MQIGAGPTAAFHRCYKRVTAGARSLTGYGREPICHGLAGTLGRALPSDRGVNAFLTDRATQADAQHHLPREAILWLRQRSLRQGPAENRPTDQRLGAGGRAAVG